MFYTSEKSCEMLMEVIESVKLSYTEFRVRVFPLSASGRQQICRWFCKKKLSSCSQYYYAVSFHHCNDEMKHVHALTNILYFCTKGKSVPLEARGVQRVPGN